ncbi:uncharacterized protein LOC120090682 [Benincasa hispida]|uniref:uncharacterized protein LOC120090682 n=1 Tax=Benincasa hispida TaxID=102211 RepID=UPI0019001129|nr:uncharacterized protein LOC120090682 [Benincasa hispida]
MEILSPSFLFHLFAINLLGLLLPLSFLLLARLSSVLYLIGLLPLSSPLLLSLILYVNSPLLFLLVSFVIVSTLFHSLTGKSALPTKLPGPVSQPRLYTAWIFLCTLQVCVGVGIEGSLSSGLNHAAAGHIEGGLWRRLLFFFGLHEAVVHWTRAVVKPVVDDTVFGESRKEKWFETAATAVSLGGLWWWRLRDEAEALVVVAESKWLTSAELGPADISGWCLYYITVAIGIAKIVRFVAWFGGIFVSTKHSKKPHEVGVENHV